jgi:hypothetical protein
MVNSYSIEQPPAVQCSRRYGGAIRRLEAASRRRQLEINVAMKRCFATEYSIPAKGLSFGGRRREPLLEANRGIPDRPSVLPHTT